MGLTGNTLTKSGRLITSSRYHTITKIILIIPLEYKPSNIWYELDTQQAWLWNSRDQCWDMKHPWLARNSTYNNCEAKDLYHIKWPYFSPMCPKYTCYRLAWAPQRAVDRDRDTGNVESTDRRWQQWETARTTDNPWFIQIPWEDIHNPVHGYGWQPSRIARGLSAVSAYPCRSLMPIGALSSTLIKVSSVLLL